MKSDYYTIPELADISILVYRTIWNWIKSGKIKAVKVKGRLRVDKASWKKLLKSC